jgi:hypothetical protein
MAVLLGVHDHGHGAQLRSGLSTLPGLPRPWTALRSRLRGPAAHSPLENRPTDAGFPHRQQALHVTVDLLGREDLR